MNPMTMAVIGTFDTKADEHRFLKEAIERRGLAVVTVNAGAKGPPGFHPDHDLRPAPGLDRDRAIETVIDRGRALITGLFSQGYIAGAISAGGGTGTHIGASIMKSLPLGVPKVMVSTVASRDMAPVVGTKDLTVIHSVGDLLGVNSLTGLILDQAAAALCAMARSDWKPPPRKKRIALTMFGFITRAAERVKANLEAMGHEVIAFHANGAGGLAMEELAREGWFDAILDLATHELADSLMDTGYCRLIGPGRLDPLPIPRLIVPGGLDCIVLEFTRNTTPKEFHNRRIFYYDFRSAISITQQEALTLAQQLTQKINQATAPQKLLIPTKGWSEATSDSGPLHHPQTAKTIIDYLRTNLISEIEIKETTHHILDEEFASMAAGMMDDML